MLHLEVFGGLSLRSDTGSLPVAATQRRRLALLALLAAAGEQGQSRDKLLAWLWPESSADRARHALDQLLYASRRDLGPNALISAAGTIRLNSSEIASDLARFEAAIDRKDLEQAAALYAGPFCDGVFLPGAPEFDRWVEGERARLERTYSDALEQLAKQSSLRGDAAGAVRWWRRLAAVQPLNTPYAVSLMRALADAGDRAGALQHARVHEELLRQELETESDPEVRAMVERLRREPAAGRVRPDDAQPGVLPAPQQAPQPTGTVHSRRRPLSPFHRAAILAPALIAVLVAGWAVMQQRSSAAPTKLPTTLAVLPFVDMSAGGGDEYFGDGVTEELIHTLSQVPGLRVVARTSAFSFKGTNADVREIGAKLGVGAVLEGSVRRAGEQVRVTVQLIDAKTGYHLWSETYDRGTADVLAVQDEIARSVVRRLRPDGAAATNRALAISPTGAEAYQLYLQGRYLRNQQTPASLREAAERFRAAIAVDSSYAPAHASLADSYIALVGYTTEPARQRMLLADAEVAARAAVRLDPHLSEARTSLGNLLLHRWDWAGAEREFRRAIDANPGSAGAHQRYGILLALTGRFDESIRSLRHAQELDPLSLAIHGSASYVLNLARRYGEAEVHARNLIAMDSTLESPHFRLGSVLLQMGRYGEAAAAFETAMRVSPSGRQRAVPMLAYTYAIGGRPAEAAKLRAEVERGIRESTISPYFAAAFFGANREPDRAFAVLDALVAERQSCLQDVAVDPVMDPLRRDPRFSRLIAQVGLPGAGR